MYLLYNNTLLPEQDFCLPIRNRAFQYNDGFFETVIVDGGKLRFWQDHIERMQEAAQALGLNLPPYLLASEFEQELLQLAGKNDALTYGRLKLKVWRAGFGLYTPQTDDIEWLATVQPAVPTPDTRLNIGICQNIRTVFSPLSHFKGPNSPVYVLASREKQVQQVDDMLLLDQQNNVAELTSSNIFWIKDGMLFTPALQTGCINGIMRRNILRWCKSEGVLYHEVLAGVGDLLQADQFFSANVTGLKEIHTVAEQALHHSAAIFTKIRHFLAH